MVVLCVPNDPVLENPTMTTREKTDRRRDEKTGRLERKKGDSAAQKAADQKAMPPRRTWMWFFVLLILNYFLVRLIMPAPEELTTVPYTFFKNQVGNGNVGAIYSEGVTITGRFIKPVAYPPADEKNTTPLDQGQTPTDQSRPTPKTSPVMTTHFTTIVPAS